MNINDLKTVSVDLPLKHPITGEALGVSLKVVGPESTEYRSARNALVDKLSANGDQKRSVKDVEADNDELLSSLIVGWSDDQFFLKPFSKEAALELIRTPELSWLRKQVDDFTEVRSNFFR